MALFEEKIDAATDYIERLSPRDRMLLLVVVGGVFLLFAFFFSLYVGGKERAMVSTNRDLELKLRKMLQIKGEFEDARRKVRALEQRLKTTGSVNLIPFLDRISRKFNINITSMNPVVDEIAPRKNSRIKASSVRIQIQAVELANLARFLDAIENSGKVVKVVELQLRPNFSDPSKPDVKAVISTYILKD